MSATATAVSSAEKPVRRFPPPCWTQDEALALIQAYRERWYALRRGYLRTADWDAVAEEVGRLSPGAVPPKTSAQCRHKIEKLRQRYRAEKQRALSFPGGRFLSTWFFFEAMDSMEKNGNGSAPNEETNTNTGSDLDPDLDLNSRGMQIVNSKITHQLNTSMDSVYGIRFKSPVAADSNLVTVASRANNIRVSHNYSAKEEDNDEQFEDVYYTETPIGKNSGKTHRSSSQNYATMFEADHRINDAVNYQNIEHYSGARPRKFSKISSSSNFNHNPNHNHGYWNENGEEDDNDLGEDDVWVKMPKDRSSVSMDYNEKYSERVNRRHCFDGEGEFSRGVRQENDSIGQIVSSIKVLADGFVKMERMKMDMVHDIEKMRMEAEMKRNTLLLESQRQIVEAFVKGLSQNKTRQQ